MSSILKKISEFAHSNKFLERFLQRHGGKLKKHSHPDPRVNAFLGLAGITDETLENDPEAREKVEEFLKTNDVTSTMDQALAKEGCLESLEKEQSEGNEKESDEKLDKLEDEAENGKKEGKKSKGDFVTKVLTKTLSKVADAVTKTAVEGLISAL